MGCTSSAPNMAPHHDEATDNNKTSSKIVTMDEIEAEIHDGKEKTNNEIKVLPKCDSLRDLIQLDRNNKSFVDAKPETDRGVQIEVINIITHHNRITHDNIENTIEDPEDTGAHLDDKLSTLEEVVEKVVEMYTDNGTVMIDATNNDSDLNTKEDETINESEMISDKAQAEEDNQREDNPEQASPSHSESSRATRWEAFADIAAELPPSLAVDPITGQIYTLAK